MEYKKKDGKEKGKDDAEYVLYFTSRQESEV